MTTRREFPRVSAAAATTGGRTVSREEPRSWSRFVTECAGDPTRSVVRCRDPGLRRRVSGKVSQDRAIRGRRFFYGDLAESVSLRPFAPDFSFFHKLQRAEASVVMQVRCVRLFRTSGQHHDDVPRFAERSGPSTTPDRRIR